MTSLSIYIFIYTYKIKTFSAVTTLFNICYKKERATGTPIIESFGARLLVTRQIDTSCQNTKHTYAAPDAEQAA